MLNNLKIFEILLPLKNRNIFPFKNNNFNSFFRIIKLNFTIIFKYILILCFEK